MNSMILRTATFASPISHSSRRAGNHVCHAQELQGRVVSTSGNNTTIVAVENISVHPLYVKSLGSTLPRQPKASSSSTRLTPFTRHFSSRYSKRVKRTVRHTCQDDNGEAAVGDLVVLKPTRPLSKTKRFIVGEILQKGN